MQSDIFKKIDTLVEMAGVSTNIDTLKAELNEIEKESKKLKNELVSLTGDSTDRYFKASEKQVDENIKVSLESKIKRQEKALKDLQKQIDSMVEEEEKLHNELSDINETIESSNDYIATLNTRLSTLTSDESLKNYKNIITRENEKLDNITSSLTTKETEYNDLLDKLNILNLAKEEMTNKLKKDKEKLSDTKANLVNKDAYIDGELKDIDDKRIKEIKKELAELDKKKLEIYTDPTMIANDAKEMMLDDDRTSALSKVKELVTIVKSKPYMDMPAGKDTAPSLEEELENASLSRDEFATLIDNKDYSGKDNQVIENRIKYLTDEIVSIQNMINTLKDNIATIDNIEFTKVSDAINETTRIMDELKTSIKEYSDIINNEDDEKTPKRRAVLQTAYERKLEEMNNLEKIIASYKKDQERLVKKAYDIETNQIKSLQEEISLMEEEINSLNKLLLTHVKTKDVLAIENDKKKLKDLDDNVKAIKHREKFDVTPSEIFDEIEIYLGTISNDDKPTEPVLNYDYDTISEDSFDQEVIDNLPEVEDEEREKLKVINVEEIDSHKSNEEENPFIIGDYQDDDYVDMNNILNENGVI